MADGLGDGEVAMLQGMRNTISTDLSNAPDFIAWKHAEDDEDTEEINAKKTCQSENMPGQKLQFEMQDNSNPLDEDDPDETRLETTPLNRLSGATELGAQIRQKLDEIPGINLMDNSPNQQLIEYLIKSVAKLSIENEMLKNAASNAGKGANSQEAGSTKSQSEPHGEGTEPIFKEFHVVHCVNSKRNYFHDSPRIFKGDLKSDHLRGLRGIENITTHLDRNKDLVFSIMHEYVCFCRGGPDYQRMVGYKDGRLLDDSPPAESKTKFVMLNTSLRNAIVRISQKHPGRFLGLEGNPRMYCLEPFLPFYTFNKTFLELAGSSDLNDFDLKSITMLCTWFEETYRAVWDETDELLSRGKITLKHYKRLFRPGELIVTPLKDRFDTTIAYRVKPHFWRDFDEKLDVEFWTFNGSFLKQESHAGLTGNMLRTANGEEVTEFDGEVDITDLIFYPLRFAKPGLRDQLIARGNRFWRCRKQTLVSYNHKDSSDDRDEKPVEHRLMIDYNMYRRMHPKNPIFQGLRDDLGKKAMNAEEPPSDEFLATLPYRIHAFDFGRKSWDLVRVDRITDVTWNKEAFKQLVVPDVTKELIQAAVTAHGHHLMAPDIITDKGQGLLILLHGGPGTGKTLTAESIAETQERPLYRITCGDIGVNPVDVEKYLESVLAIGRAWGCVVLLDEADVFLEERNVADQIQNAIASVFLRALEYYDGILILTTNRVGTFDEAFKSRIHLAIRYTKLDEDQRVEIWRNFIRMLAKTKERVDIRDLEQNVHKLAQVELNGRQIRNVITLARYLARFRKQMLVYKHVQDAFASVVKFDEYLLQLRGSDDRWATESRLR